MSIKKPLNIKIAQTILDGFERHFSVFQSETLKAKTYFEKRQQQNIQHLVKCRIDFYDKRTNETSQLLKKQYQFNQFDEVLWRQIKHNYTSLLRDHSQPELAETFFNSIFCNLFERRYYNNNFIFVRPSVSNNYTDLHDPILDSYSFNNADELRVVFKQILLKPSFKQCGYQDLPRDIERLKLTFYKHLKLDANQPLAIEVIKWVFFRNNSAYIIGKVISQNSIQPICIALSNDTSGIFVDALVMSSESLAVIFSFSRSYFLLHIHSPAVVVAFLKVLMPTKTDADLYSAIGLHKQGKTIFYRMFLYHNATNKDLLQIAPGIAGMAMLVFTFPVYPYVFKLIRDRFRPPKNITSAQIRQKYHIIKTHNRIGRLADTWEFSNVAFPMDKISPILFDELKKEAAASLEFDDDLLIIKHLYIEKKITPLNIYLNELNDEKEIEHIVYDYGLAIKELIQANIFPGDMLLKNFGVTSTKRVVFYDYDEVVSMEEVNFRHIPEPQNHEQEMASEPWYYVSENDIFPEEFCQFLFNEPISRNYFLQHHSDLLTPEYWQSVQQKIKAGKISDIFPYPQKYRMSTIYKQ